MNCQHFLATVKVIKIVDLIPTVVLEKMCFETRVKRIFFYFLPFSFVFKKWLSSCIFVVSFTLVKCYFKLHKTSKSISCFSYKQLNQKWQITRLDAVGLQHEEMILTAFLPKSNSY